MNMWIMLVTFFFYAAPHEHISNAALTSAEFTSKESCEAARKVYLDQFAAITSEINHLTRQGVQGGTFARPAGISVTALCIKK
jgi:hypothetical protein